MTTQKEQLTLFNSLVSQHNCVRIDKEFKHKIKSYIENHNRHKIQNADSL